MGHAKILIGKKQNDLDQNIIEKMINSKLSVRELERNLSKRTIKSSPDINIINEEKNLSTLIGFKSQIKYNSKGQGYIKIFYDNLEQYDFIVKKIIVFLSVVVIVLVMLLYIIDNISINAFNYNSLVIVTLGSFGIERLKKFSPS